MSFEPGNYVHEGDLVWCPSFKNGQPNLPGKILAIRWKATGAWCKVEVTYTDMAGQTHTTIIPKIHGTKLTKRKGTLP